MRIFIVRITLCLLFFSASLYSTAQSNLLDIKDYSTINIDDYTDADLKSFYNKVSQLKMDEGGILSLLEQRGMPQSEMDKLKIRLQSLAILPSNNTGVNGNHNSVEAKRTVDSSAAKLPMRAINKDLSIFGAELFVKTSMLFEPNLRIATPSSYVLGPDDEVIVNVYGLSEKKYNLTINEEGEIYIPNVGPLFVNGLTIEEAAQKIKAKLAATIYRAIGSGQTKVQVSLGKIRSIRVTIIGQAEHPGTYTVSSLTTLYNALYLCGGPNENGSYRKIEIVRGNSVKKVADLYSFLVYGKQTDNVLLQEGDVIRIPYYSSRVEINGEVKRQGKFEMLENETLANLLQYAGGFKERAYKQQLYVTRIGQSNIELADVNADRFGAFATMPGDVYRVATLSDKISNKVTITGAVLRPGSYALSANLDLKQLVEKAGGLLDDAFTGSASVYRLNPNRTTSVWSFNLDSALKANAPLLLRKDDSLAIYSVYSFMEEQLVSIEGNVKRPAKMRWRQNLMLKDLLLYAGGISSQGDSARIEIARRKKSNHLNRGDFFETETFIIQADENNELSQNIALHPYDIVIVKNISGFIPQRTVMIMGEVQVPGRYGLQTSTDRISDVIARTGGFKNSADSNNVTIRRMVKSNFSIAEREALFQRLLNVSSDSLLFNSKLRNDIYKSYELVSVNLKAALKHPESVENLALEDGDILVIDKNSQLIKVSGEVYYPTILPINTSKSAKYYIKQAGDFMPDARRSGTIVIYPNGKAKSVKSFLFFRTYPNVTPRSEIYVPQKNKNNRAKVSTGEWALIVSALGIAANVIIATVK